MINEINYLHSLDSLKLAKEIQKYRVTPLNTFIQLNLSKEESKFGIDLSELKTFVKELTKYDKINLIGFMTIGIQDDLIQTEKIFETLNQLKIDYMLQYTSMGMSHELAIKHALIGSIVHYLKESYKWDYSKKTKETVIPTSKNHWEQIKK